MQDDYILRVQNITKSFPGVKALDSVSLNVRRGTVHAVMGENGAGKSTLMKILFGIYHPDSGSIWFKGKQRNFATPHEALKSGLAMIHQELSGVRQLSVSQNIFLGKEIVYKGTNVLNMRKMNRETEKLMESLHLDVDPRAKMGDLSVSRQQLCELAKAVSYNADLIIMDEPTSAMTESEVKHLYTIISELTKKGVAIIYITHKLDEIFNIVDEISVYRDGKHIGTAPVEEMDISRLVEMMVGRSITQIYPKEQVESGDTLLTVDGLSCKGIFENVSFNLKRGEIVGLAGLIGAGRSEVMETLFGIRKKSHGKIFINGEEVKINCPKDAITHKMAMLTEDRKYNGCFLPLTVSQNIIMASIKKYCTGIFLKRKSINNVSNNMKDSLNIKTPSLEQTVLNLSGGNQQKVLVGRWLLTEPEIIIFDEPTRGIDVGTKNEIYKMLTVLAKQGKGIIIISSELLEVLGMSDRILVMCEGRITGELQAKEATQERVFVLAAGESDINENS